MLKGLSTTKNPLFLTGFAFVGLCRILKWWGGVHHIKLITYGYYYYC